MMCKLKGGCKRERYVQLKEWMAKCGHYVEIKGWMQKGAIRCAN